ncbi:MAG: imidazole glycerol phosphate synthase subunit HisH [Prevotellaceae bacterium]|jgi:glutamine amidotransferase|nr:imidazole glycerol phosphate synthase subunit HisH [Prevotellaceae bacterium]
MQVAIIQYNAGNLFSVDHALRRLGIEPIITDDPAILRTADKVVLPGQGEASATMSYLAARGLDKVIKDLRQPVLGICIGLQLMCRHSEEGDVDCLGIFPTEVRRFVPERHEDKVPHIGWNTLEHTTGQLFDKLTDGEFAYYLHSYYALPCEYTIAVTNYICSFSASLHRDNFYATQFHPEKSGGVGERILQNFLSL